MSQFFDLLIVSPLPDGKQWALCAAFGYRSDLTGARIVVPEDFITDFASIPEPLQALYPVWQRYGAAAIIHDFLYWSQRMTRDVADSVLREAMQVLGVDEHTVNTIYLAVRMGGQTAWDRNAQLKASGYTRMASMNITPPYAAAI